MSQYLPFLDFVWEADSYFCVYLLSSTSVFSIFLSFSSYDEVVGCFYYYYYYYYLTKTRTKLSFCFHCFDLGIGDGEVGRGLVEAHVDDVVLQHVGLGVNVGVVGEQEVVQIQANHVRSLGVESHVHDVTFECAGQLGLLLLFYRSIKD